MSVLNPVKDRKTHSSPDHFGLLVHVYAMYFAEDNTGYIVG